MRWRHDRPTPSRPHRVYVALTNQCNRACPWCSTCSSPAGRTFLSESAFRQSLPTGLFELQLEGGEPTLHPAFGKFLRIAREAAGCRRLVVATNGSTLPEDRNALVTWLRSLGEPLTLKVSANHHLMEADGAHVEKLVMLRDTVQALAGERLLVINARVRTGAGEDDRAVVDALRDAGLMTHANVFCLQRYGRASERRDWPLPKPATLDFTLVNPDGAVFGADLVERSEAMRCLP